MMTCVIAVLGGFSLSENSRKALIFIDLSLGRLKAILQRYILKAIHNNHRKRGRISVIESDIAKIHFESNSQPQNTKAQTRAH
jgi:hypothetical protein